MNQKLGEVIIVVYCTTNSFRRPKLSTKKIIWALSYTSEKVGIMGEQLLVPSSQ